MAALTSSAVTVVQSWALPGSPLRTKVKLLTLVLTGQGGTTNTIDASTLGFAKILRVSSVQRSDDSVVNLAAPSYDGTKIFLYNLEQATDASRGDPADVTGTVRLTVEGF